MSSSMQQHWDQLYATKSGGTLSWFQREPAASLDLIAAAGVRHDQAIVDVGGGTSFLVDRLLDRGFANVAVLDVSERALAATKARLGLRADRVRWIVGDITKWQPPPETFALWHDRAVFHFLVDHHDRSAYLLALWRALAPGGFLVIATFALSGPERCSGLPVQRYSAETLRETLGSGYALIKTAQELHTTPSGNAQDFVWCLFRKTLDPIG